jgi:hypothetical protein
MATYARKAAGHHTTISSTDRPDRRVRCPLGLVVDSVNGRSCPTLRRDRKRSSSGPPKMARVVRVVTGTRSPEWSPDGRGPDAGRHPSGVGRQRQARGRAHCATSAVRGARRHRCAPVAAETRAAGRPRVRAEGRLIQWAEDSTNGTPAQQGSACTRAARGRGRRCRVDTTRTTRLRWPPISPSTGPVRAP